MGAFDRAVSPELVVGNPLEDAGSPNEFIKGLRRGITGNTAGLQATLGQVIQPVAPDIGTSLIQDALETTQGVDQRNAARVGVWGNVHNLSDLADYAVYKGAEALPALPVAMAGGLAGKALGVGGAVGGAAAFQPVMMGAEAMRLQEDEAAAGLTPAQKLMYSGGVGTAEAAAMGAVPGMMGGRLISRAPARSLSGAAGRAVLDTGINSVGMGAGMAAADIIGQKAQTLYNPDAVYNPEQTEEAFIGGTVAGLPLAAPHAALARGMDLAKTGVVDAPMEATRSALARVRDRLPDAVKPFADAVIGGGEVTVDIANALKPYVDILGIGARSVFDRVSSAAKGAAEDLSMKHDANLLTLPDVALAGADVAAAAVGGVKGVAPEIAKALKEQAKIDGVSLDIGSGKSASEDFVALSEYMKERGGSVQKRLGNPQFDAMLARTIGERISRDSSLDSSGVVDGLLEKVAAGQQLTPAESARLWAASSVITKAQLNRERFRNDIKRLGEWQDSTGKAMPTDETGLQFSKQKVKDQARESAKDVFGSSQMREALAELQVAPEVIDSVLDRIQAKDIKERGVELVVRRAVTAALTKRGMKDFARRGAPAYDLMTSALRDKLAEKFPRKQKENAPAEREQSPEFERMMGEIVGELITSSSAKELKDPADALDASYAVSDFIDKLSSGKSGYYRRANEFRDFMVRNFGDNARSAMDKIMALAEAEYSDQPERLQRLGALRESTNTMDAITAELKKQVGFGGMAMANHMMDRYFKARDIDTKARDFSRYYNGAKRQRELADALEEHAVNHQNADVADKLMTEAANRRARADELERYAAEASRDTNALGRLRDEWIGSGALKADANTRGDVFDRVTALMERYAKADKELTDAEKARRDGRGGGFELADEMDTQSYLRKILREAGEKDGDDKALTTLDNETGQHHEGDAAQWFGTGILHTENRGKLTRSGVGTGDKAKAEVNTFEPGSFLSTYPSKLYADKYGNPRSPLEVARELVYEQTGHRVADIRTKTVSEWVDEIGGDPETMLKQAAADVVAHDKRMIAEHSGKLAQTEIDVMKRRIANYESGMSGIDFFLAPEARKLRMLKVEQNSGDTMRVDEHDLAMSSVKNVFTHESGETPAAYVKRMHEQEGTFATTEPYKKALLPIKLTEMRDGKKVPVLDGDGHAVLMHLDFAKLVQRVLSEHQRGDTAGVESENFMHMLRNTVHEVVGALLDSGSVDAGALKAVMKKTNTGEILPLDLVVYRGKGKDNARAFTYGQVAGIKEITSSGDVLRKNVQIVEGKRSGKYRAEKGSDEIVTDADVKGTPFKQFVEHTDVHTPQVMSRYISPSTAAGRATKGTARAVLEKDGVTYDLNLKNMLIEMLHSNEIDGQRHVMNGDLPERLASKMLHEGFANLEAAGYKLDRSKLGSVEVYEKQYGDKTIPVKQSKLNADPGDVPRNIEAAKEQETRDLVKSYSEKVSELQSKLSDAKTHYGADLTGRARLAEDRTAAMEGNIMLARQIINDLRNTGYIDLRADVYSKKGNVRVLEGRKSSDADGLSEMEAIRIKEALGGFERGEVPVFDTAEAHGAKHGATGSLEGMSGEQRRVKDAWENRHPKEVLDEATKVLREHIDELNKTWGNIREAQRLDREFPMGERDMEQRYGSKEIGVEPKAPSTRDINDAKNRAAEAELKEAPIVAAKTKLAREQKNEHAARKAQARLLKDEREARRVDADLNKRLSAVETDAVSDLALQLDAAEKPLPVRALTKEIKSMTPEQRSLLRDTLSGSESAASKHAISVLDSIEPTGARGEDVPFSKQRPEGVEATAKAMQAEHQRLVGKLSAAVEVVEGLTHDGAEITGKYSKATKEAVAKLVLNAAAGMRGVHHETWHHIDSLLEGMGERGKHIRDIVYKAMEAEHVQEWLREKLAGDTAALEQLASPSERAAFAFQHFMAGETVPLSPKVRSIWREIADWVRDLIGLTSDEQKANNFFKYIKEEGLARDIENPEALIRGIGETRIDNFIGTAKKIVEPANEVLDKLLEHGDNRVRKHGVKQYGELMDKYVGDTGKGGFQSAKHFQYYRWANKFVSFFIENKDADFLHKDWAAADEAFTGYMRSAMMEGGLSREAADKQITALQKNLDGYNRIEAADRFDELVADIANHGGIPKERNLSARDVASHIADMGFFFDPEFKLFDKSPAIAAKWRSKTPMDKAISYAKMGTELAERTRSFGEVTKETPYGKEFHRLLAEGDANASKQAQQDMQEFIKGWEHTYENTMSTGLKKVIGAIQLFENARLLPLAVFAQALEPMQLALRRNSFEGIGGTLWRGIKNLPRAFDWADGKYTPDYWERFSMQLGTAQHRVLDGAVAHMVNGMRIPGRIGWVNDKFFQYNFMNTWNRTMHIEATKHAVEFLKEHARGLDKVHSQRFLDELHVSKDEVLKNIIRPEDGVESLRLTPNIERAIAQWVNEAMAHADAGSNPFWMNDPRFALISQMKRFTFAHSKFMLDRGISEFQKGNTWVLAPAVAAMPWMLASDAIRDTLTGKDMSYRDNWGVSDYAAHAFERAGHTGKSQFGMDAWRDVKMGGSGLDSLLGPAAQSFGDVMRGANSGHIIDSLLGNSPSGRLLGV